MRTPRSLPTLFASASVAALLGACGGGGGGGSDDIASLGGEATTTTEDGGGGGGDSPRESAEFEDAMLAYAECMRGEGVDMPDPQTQDGGMVIMGGPGGPGSGPPGDADVEAFETADEECRPIIEEAVGEMEPPSPEEQEQMREDALAFAECMREHGIDMPDPEFSDDGGIGIRVGSDEAPAGGAVRPGGFDPEDEDFQEAAEECGGETGFGTVTRSAGGGDG